MFQNLYVYFFIRILKTCFLFQLIFFITLSMNHIPSFLMKMKGFNFGIDNLFIMLGLCLLDFFNLLTIISFILAISVTLIDDFLIRNMKLFFIQISFSSMKFFHILISICAFYGILFVVNDLFIVPESNLYLQKKGLELYKNKIFYSIKPRHVVNIPELNANISIVDRINNQLIGCLLHSESYNAFLLIERMVFNQDSLLKLDLYHTKGKIITTYDTILFDYDFATIKIDLDVITISKKNNFFKLNTFEEFFNKFKIFLLSILIAFWIFILIFSKKKLMKIIVSMMFGILLSNVLEIISINWLTFLFFSVVIVLYFFKVEKCLDF